MTRTDDGLRAIAGSDMVTLRTDVPLHGEGMTTRSNFTVRKGEDVTFTLTNSSSLEKAPKVLSVKRALAETQSFWRGMEPQKSIRRSLWRMRWSVR